MAFGEVRPEEVEEEHIAGPSMGLTIRLAMDLANRDTEVMSMARSQAVNELNERGPKVDPSELNKRFPGVGFDRPTTLYAAQHIFDETTERMEKEAILDRAKGFWKGGVVPFAAAAVETMKDPIGFGVGALLGAGATKLATKMPAAMSGLARTRVGLAIAENAVANTISELTFTKGAADAEFQELTREQMMTNIIGGSLAGVALGEGFGAVFKRLGKNKAKVADASYRNLEEAFNQGKSVAVLSDEIETGILKDLEVTPEMKSAFDDVLGERASILTPDDPETKLDVNDYREKIKQAALEGRVREEDLVAIQNRMQQDGVPETKIKAFFDNYAPSEEFINKIDQKMRDPSTDTDFNPKQKEVEVKKVDATDDIDVEDLKLRKEELREAMKLSEEEGRLDALERESLSKIDELDREMEDFDIAEEYFNCRFAD